MTNADERREPLLEFVYFGTADVTAMGEYTEKPVLDRDSHPALLPRQINKRNRLVWHILFEQIAECDFVVAGD